MDGRLRKGEEAFPAITKSIGPTRALFMVPLFALVRRRFRLPLIGQVQDEVDTLIKPFLEDCTTDEDRHAGAGFV
jgi:uncharacterized membrane protein YGL010W